MAAKIMAMPDSAISGQQLAPKQPNPKTAPVQRAAQEDKTISPELENRIQNATGGSPLPEAVQAFMEPRFGVDFSAIRVHRDYARATRGKDNVIIVGGNKLFKNASKRKESDFIKKFQNIIRDYLNKIK